MPTGYTAAIADGISFEKFVWSCARAFGALVTMRDDPTDTPIWGNPHPWREYIENAPAMLETAGEREAWAKQMAVDALREDLASGDFSPPLSELRGKNLACWCKPGEPCHADVLLELANEVRP